VFESAESFREVNDSARIRGERVNDFGETAVWFYPANKPKRPTILMIHGFRGDHHGLQAIAGALPDFNVLIPDLPGYGKSKCLPGLHNIPNYGDWLLELAKQVRSIHGQFHLVAHSFGTQIASDALSKGLKVKSVTLLNPITRARAGDRSIPAVAAKASYQLARSLGPLGSALLRSWLLVQVMSSTLSMTKEKALRKEIHQQHHRYFSNYREDRVAHEGYASACVDVVSPSSVPIGSLIVVGSKDLVAPLDNQILSFKNREDLIFEVLQGAGHLVHYEHPMAVAQLIRERVTAKPRRQN